MVYPETVKTPGDRLAYCYAALQALMTAHNVVGAWKRTGTIDAAKFATLPKDWQASLSTAPQKEPIADKDWDAFLKTEYHKAEAIIVEALCEAREAVKKDPAILSSVDLDAALADKVIKDGS